MAGTESSMLMNVAINLEENEPLGARPNEGLVITDVQEGTPAAGHLEVGDTVQSVNRHAIPNLAAFYRALRVAHPVANIEIKRPRNREETPVEVVDNLPPEIRNVITRQSGYHYELLTLERIRGIKFGLAIKTRDNRVIVTEVSPEGMCAKLLKPCDHIVYVDGVRVSQAEVAHTLLAKGLKSPSGRAELVIGRPTTPEAIAAARQALSREDVHDPPSVRLNLDVQMIMRQQIVSMATYGGGKPPAGIAYSGPTPPQPDSKRVSFSGQNTISRIHSDNVGRALRPVVTGTPNSPIRQQQGH